MSAPRTRVVRRPVHGVLLLDKPLGLSSNQALQKAKWLLRAEKAGHTGTLDPLATGVLPLCFGAATKFSGLHLDADKTYEATIQLGVTTTTGDAEGEVLAQRAVPAITAEQLEAVRQRFLGRITQVPPMHSALKKDGKALYEYARQGIEVERTPRTVEIYKLNMAPAQSGQALAAIDIEVSCSKGTYIRTLGEDIGQALGCGGHLSRLRRTATGPFMAAQCITLQALEALDDAARLAALLPPEALLPDHLPITLEGEEAGRFLAGMRRRGDWPDAAQVAVFGALPRALLGTAHVRAGELIAQRLLSPVELQQMLGGVMNSVQSSAAVPPTELWTQALRAWQAGACAEVLALLAPSLDGPQPAADMLQLAALAHQRLGELPQALQRQQQWVDRHPQQAAGWINLANIQADLGQVDAGLDSLARALALDPQQAAAHFNRGNLLMRQGDPGAAFDAFRRAGELAPERPDPPCNQAQALCALGRFGEALAIMQSVVARYPGLAAGWNGLGMVWHRLSDDAQALRCYQRAVQIDANLADAWSNAAQVLARLERPDEAAQWARRAVELGGGQAAARTLGVVLVSDRHRPGARQWLEQALQSDPGDTIALNNLLTLDSVQCDWDALDRHLQALRSQWQQGRFDGLQPWRLLSLPVGAAELRAVTEQDCVRRFAHVTPTEPGRWRVYVGKPRPARLRVGYFSSDFHQHATSVLMAGLFERHDRSRFEIFGFCLGRYRASALDPMRARVQAAFEHFEAVGEFGDPQVIARARGHDLHIAVDLKGHTHQSRPRLFAERMAPIQMHYIGYPGTLGMPGAIDYQVADRIVVPPEARDGYSEKIIELPVSYQANDRTRMMDPQVPARAALGLPDGAFVFCCFNNNYKITREVFALWMDLLRERPGSVLWLLAEQGDAQRNLRAAAAAQGVDPARLVFAERAPLPQHLARHAQADLFLDTWPCNAHTTASDALWAGLPLITCAGSTFASRVAASLLHACELPQLVADSPQAYRALALSLSAAPERLQAIRRRLLDARQTLSLFDAERFARHLERAFDLAWERHVRGQPPDHLAVEPLPQ